MKDLGRMYNFFFFLNNEYSYEIRESCEGAGLVRISIETPYFSNNLIDSLEIQCVKLHYKTIRIRTSVRDICYFYYYFVNNGIILVYCKISILRIF